MRYSIVTLKKAFVIIVYLLMFWFMEGCTPKHRANKKLQRAERLIKRAKYLDPSVSIIDTVKVSNTVYVESVKVDTVIESNYDTITIEKERLKIRYKLDSITNTVYLEGECIADTIYQDIKVPFEVLVYEKSILDKLGIDRGWEKGLFWLLVTLVFLGFIYLKVKPI